FTLLQKLLGDSGISFTLNPKLVRGLDYYTRTVFEWQTDQLGAQSAVCSGGRYDGLVEQLGGRSTPATGWALGVERLVELMQLAEAAVDDSAADIYIVMVGDQAVQAGMQLGEKLRDQLPGVRLWNHCGGGSFKAQMRAADRSGARLAIILGESEVAQKQAAIKALRDDTAQSSCDWDELPGRVAAFLN
ncbi:MAG: ATP phosphoribosyltransferase regulatory subunit, partial [Gammaproteobacteria bacterium]|nr:ATP phosphoribosyltransferase regulatory subunit [Gammaproteobacteria bacterium]